MTVKTLEPVILRALGLLMSRALEGVMVRAWNHDRTRTPTHPNSYVPLAGPLGHVYLYEHTSALVCVCVCVCERTCLCFCVVSINIS